MYDSQELLKNGDVVEVEEAAVADYAPGDTERTAVTNELAAEKGYPAETSDGLIVNIVKKIEDAQQGTVLIDSDGNRYAGAANQTQDTRLRPLDEPDEPLASEEDDSSAA